MLIFISVVSFIVITTLNKRILLSYDPTLDPSIYLWSKRAISLAAYNMLPGEHISTPNIIAEHIKSSKDILWIRNGSFDATQKTDLDHLGVLLDTIQESVILVTGEGDRAVPSSYSLALVDKILNSPKIIKWYTQNYDRSVIHPKLKHYPIGLDMHTTKWLRPSLVDVKAWLTSADKLRAQKWQNYLAIRDKYAENKKIEYCAMRT